MAQVIYYKKLICNNYNDINQQVIDFINHHDLSNRKEQFWNPIIVTEFVRATPLLQQWLLDLDLRIKTVAVTVGHDIKCCGAHVDTPPAIYKLSWPVANTQHSFNRWFREINNNCTVCTNELGGRIYLDYNDLEEVDRMRVDGPAIINVGQPHDVWFEDGSQFPRIGLQCQFLKEPML
jgi:hypothetical protein